MVNTVDSTQYGQQPRASNVGRLQIRLQPQQEEQLITDVWRRLEALTSAARRLLDALYDALLLESSPGDGYSFRSGLTRTEIASALNKPQLVPYDIKKLRAIVEVGLMSEEKRVLPTKLYIGDDGVARELGNGFEYVYRIGSRVLYCLALARDPDGFKASLKEPATAAPNGSTERQPVRTAARIDGSTIRNKYRQPVPAVERRQRVSLADRINAVFDGLMALIGL